MIFLGLFMMPFYYGSKARSVPEYLKLRFDEKTRAFNALSFAVMTIFSSGISLHMLAKIIGPIIGVSYNQGLIISAAIVLVYIYLGGLTSAIYNEVLQFFLIVLGFLPVVLLGLRRGGLVGVGSKAEPRGRGGQEYLSSRTRLPAGHVDRHLETHVGRCRQSDGDRPVRHDYGARLRAVVRLLVHQFPGGAAGDGGRVDVGRPADPPDRRHPENALSRPGDPAGHDRHGGRLEDV